MFESYFIRKGFVKLTLDDLRKMPSDYAGKLYITLKELDLIQKEIQEANSKKGLS